MTNVIFFLFDRAAEICQAIYMSYHVKKFIAVFIALWLPLFSGNALAVSVAMKAMGGVDHAVVAQKSEHCLHHATADQHTQPSAGDEIQSAGFQEQQGSACGSDICHVACSGYMATVSITVAAAQLLALTYDPSSTKFQSIALTLLDPPPLARA